MDNTGKNYQIASINWHYRSCNYSSYRWQDCRMRNRDMAKAFAAILRKHRKEHNITQEVLAEKADVASKMVSLIERGERNPSLNLADSIAQSLGVPLSDLIKEAETFRKKGKSKN
jgi:DNA-binding XRE family transcriptional regulator